MTDLIFAYTPPETNWLNPDWRKFKMQEIYQQKQRNAMAILEERFLDATRDELAKKLGVSSNYYSVLRTKYNLKKEKLT